MINETEKFSLITTPWLPVRFKDGTQGKMAPVDITNEDIVDLVANRADFQGAAWQFMIGLLQTALAPSNSAEWGDIWDDGLNNEKVKHALLPLAEHFIFGESSPSFMQDIEPLAGESVDIALLLPETPGNQAIKLNKDHFIKRDVTKYFCPHCAALALFALQLNAPAGGKGYRTGLRGGGPMTTLVELHSAGDQQQIPLWRKIWANVMPQDMSALPLPQDYDASVFPWLGPTRTSEKDKATTPVQVNKLQAYWGMPRRIRIDFSDVASGSCHLCGGISDQLLSSMKVKNYGVKYECWEHPLTPYRRPKKELSEKYSLKAQPGGLLWRDWLGLNWEVTNDNNDEFPALATRLFVEYRPRNVISGLWGFGYDFDNMKARCWYEHHFPVMHIDKAQRNALLPHLQEAAKFASQTISQLRSALKEAWFSNPKNARGDFSFIDIDFWHRTQPAFFELVSSLEQGGEGEQLITFWRGYLWQFAREEFDKRVFTNPYEPVDMKRIMTARKKYFTRVKDKPASRSRRSKQQEAQ
ncbi:type I-E CRISPR-associated protein Cse1/CasA [Atlantibacter subterraneus]|uniref:type I-E CRISPR-associated protein Cse1/CasA n=1 Tax=Atlantibacter subterraneus TaxID=255519 RepID=UPI002964EE1A|nr:type I-E CRISPR-associated protein Cse1/CasA [Atlantibacter subterranea]MDW2741849.1 type I-E CRISPR-associated protein Cse1/CasA [Atlantibacter subterranea]